MLTHTVHILWVPRSSYLAIPIQAYAPEVRRAQKNNHHPTRPFFFFFFFQTVSQKIFRFLPKKYVFPPGNGRRRRQQGGSVVVKGPRLLRRFSPSSPPLPPLFLFPPHPLYLRARQVQRQTGLPRRYLGSGTIMLLTLVHELYLFMFFLVWLVLLSCVGGIDDVVGAASGVPRCAL